MCTALRWLELGQMKAEGWRDREKVLEEGTRGCMIALSCFGTGIASWQLVLHIRRAYKCRGGGQLTSLLRQRHLLFLRQLNHFHTEYAP